MAENSLRPPEIAREALRRLAMERLAPTPDNYRAYYHKISGAPTDETVPERPLRLIASSLPRNTPERLKLAQQFDEAIASRQWHIIKQAILALATTTKEDRSTPAATELLAFLLQKAILPIVSENAQLAAEAREIADHISALKSDAGFTQALSSRLHALTNKIEWAEEDQRAVRQALLNLLKLIVDNISELVVDDNWLQGQIGLVAEVFSRPLDIRMLSEVERRLRDVIDKQSHLKRQLTDAQIRLRDMLAGFVDRLASFSDSTDHYHTTLSRCAEEIKQADNIDDLANVVELMLSETHEVQETARRSGEELNTLRSEVDAANHRIISLQRELDETSELVRHDPLTGALNRKGLDEALEREISVSRRRESPLCIALLDIDNFKEVNDTFGHRTGDDALRHLATVMRECLRPQDLVGRYGGEEFVILLPDTDEPNGIAAISRLQRELTKRLFLAENKRILITFSAGIALLSKDEDPYLTIDRADKAMYAAKRAGKNRVLFSA